MHFQNVVTVDSKIGIPCETNKMPCLINVLVWNLVWTDSNSHLSRVSWVELTFLTTLNQFSISEAHSGYLVFFHVLFQSVHPPQFRSSPGVGSFDLSS